ncbi:MAG TPA: sigma-70 family RNA polymerase sigma factor [Kofleriaceae bacterium]|jgi:RNA polymerase sigma-70 factor (ECF subfamily)|nr:sigma-70 family RNA polymerase sigma factor [Kofleriaceae bacterium]
MTAPDAAASFEPHRGFLRGLAYRMLGSIAEAEDVVQDAFLRWNAADRAQVAEPRAFLARTASRLCLDRMKAASTRREHYAGTWLPEPLVEPAGAAPPSAPAALALALAEDVSVALLVTLERLSPLERAAFLLHDVFDMDYANIAEILDRSEAACRQLATRGRDHVRDERPRFAASPDATARLAGAFHAALRQGDLAGFARLLADDAVLYSDGGGKRNAALRPIHGRDKIVRFVLGLADKGWLPVPVAAEPVQINGLPGFVIRTAEGPETLALEISGDAIVAIYGVRNPEKLRHLGQSDVPDHPAP